MSYTPTYLSRKQIHTESGGKQFGSDGKPLTSPKGAIGVAQVMPGTGPEAAKLAGLPWDEHRYKNDADYNLQIGDAYMGAKLKEFGGDRVKAEAAYNAGAGNVRKAMRRAEASGGDWRDYLPAETQGYIGHKGTGNRGMPLSGKGIQVAMKETPEGSVASDVKGANPFQRTRSDNPVMNPFQGGDIARDRLSDQQESVNVFQRMVGEQSEAVDNLQEERRAELESTVAAKQGILDQQLTDTQRMIADAAPIMQVKSQVDAQLHKVRRMNPLEKGLRGIFDLNYNEKYLREQAAGLQQDLVSRQQSFQVQTNLREAYLNTLEAQFNNNDSVRNLTLKEFDEDSKMVGQGILAAEKNFEIIKTGLATNAQVIQSQQLAVSNFLDQLTPVDHNALLEKALTSPTKLVEVNGMQVSAGEIRQRIQNQQRLDMSLQSQQMALAAGQMEFAEKNQENIIDSMTETQVKQAVASGGVFNGIQLDPTKLNQRAVGFMNLRQHEVAGIAAADVGNQMLRVKQQTWEGLRAGLDRYIAVVGGNDQSFGLKENFANQFVALSNRWREMQKAGVGAEGAAAIAQEFQALTKSFEGYVKKAADRFGGGDKSTAAVMSAYMTGGELSTEEATGAMYNFVDKGSMPAGLRRSPVVNAMYNFVKAKRAEVAAKYQGKSIGKDQLRRETMEGVLADGGQRANQFIIKETLLTAPQFAKASNHKAGAIDPNAWKIAWQAGEKTFKEHMDQNKGLQGADLAKARTEAMSAKYTATFDTLEQLAGREASGSMMDFLESAEFTKHLQQYSEHQKNFGVGDFMVNALSVGTLGTQAAGNIRMMGNVYRERAVDEAVSKNKSKYHVLPSQRIRMIVGGIPGVSDSDEKPFMAALEHQFPGLNDYGDYSNQVQAVRGFIMGGKFNDPNLERIRKQAAKEWDSTDQLLERAMNR